MVSIRPLRLRIVRSSWAERVCSPAHDALTPLDRRTHLAAHPDSYLAVTRGVEDLAPDQVLGPTELLQQGRVALDRLRQVGAFGRERGDEFYVLRLDNGRQRLTGIVAGVSVTDYREGRVRVHEHVKAHRAIHLANHLDVVGVQSSPIALAHRPDPAISSVIAGTTATDPLLDFTLPDGLTQTVWTVADPADDATLRSALDDDPLYLIDGHHRAAAADTYRAAAGPGRADWMLSAIFSTNELDNAPHHRLLHPPNGIDEGLRSIGRHRRLRMCERRETEQRRSDEIALYARGQWYCLSLPERGGQAPADLLADLDPSRLQDQVLGPLFRIDPEHDEGTLTYLAGQRGLAELEAVADAERGLLALMRHVSVDTLIDAADAGLVMPPKSTYFEPKVRSGVFLRTTSDGD